MKNLLFVLVFSFFVLGSKSQSKDLSHILELGQPQKEKANTLARRIVCQDEEGYIVLNQSLSETEAKGSGFRLLRFNFQYDIVKDERFEVRFQNKYLDLIALIRLGEKLIAFSTHFDNKKKRKYLFALTINPTTLKPTGSYNKICDVAYPRDEINIAKTGYGEDLDLLEDYFHIALSPDSSKFMVYHRLNSKRKEAKIFKLYSFDAQVKKLWEKDMELPYRSHFTDFKDLAISNAGKVYLIAKVYKDKKREKRKKKPNYTFKLFCYGSNGQFLKEIDFEHKRLFLGHVGISTDQHSNVYCTGFVQIKRKAEGVLWMKINGQKGEIISKQFELFGPMLNNRGKEDLSFPRVKEIFHNEDGSLVLVGEEQEITAESSLKKEGESQFIYGDVVLIKFAPQGKVKWATLLPKLQTATSTDYLKLSCSVTRAFGRYLIIYNNGELAYKHKRIKKILYEGKTKASTILAEVKHDGQVSQKVLFNFRKQGFVLLPETFLKISENELLFVGKANEKQSIGKLKLRTGDDL